MKKQQSIIETNEKNSFLLHFVDLAAFYLKRRHLKPGTDRWKVMCMLLWYFLYVSYSYTRWFIIKHVNNSVREKRWFIKGRKWIYLKLGIFHRQLVHVNLPENLKPETGHLFTKNDYYFWRPLNTKELDEAFIYLTQDTGIVVNKLCIDQESIHGWWDKRQVEVQKPYPQRALEGLMASKLAASSEPLLLNKNKGYILIHHWFNYYHWLTESLLRLWMVKDQLEGKKIILPETLEAFNYVAESLKAFGAEAVFIKYGQFPTVRNLLMVENKQYCDHYPPSTVREIGSYLTNHALSELRLETNYGKKIYVSRKKALRRNVVNEDEVERLLSSHGFKPVVLEEFSFFEQVSIISKAKYLISMHGAGLTNIMFMQPGSHVLEFHKEVKTSEDHHSVVYWKLASAMEHHYYCQFCPAENTGSSFLTANLIVGIDELQENLDMMLPD